VRSGEIDPEFLSFPLDDLADAGLSRAKDLGATHAEFRFERRRSQTVGARDRNLERLQSVDQVGFGLRVIFDGGWGFASEIALSPESARTAAENAVLVAKQFRTLNSEPVELAAEPTYEDTHVSSFEKNPFEVESSTKIEHLLSLNERVLSSGKIDHVDSSILQVQENKFFASLSGSRITQQRIRVNSDFTATKVDKSSGAFETMSSTSPPLGKGWEGITNGHDYFSDAERIPELLEEKIKAKSVEPGRYDLVIHPSNLWLTIHESIGHSTELDRALGYEATLAGTSFATTDKLGELHVGSEVMHVTGDRVVEHGLSTVGYDDEGVKAQQWDIIKDGVLVGYQLNRQMASKIGLDRSNGCAYADSPSNVPIQRMPNVTLQPSPKAISLDDLIGAVDRGIYIVGNKSWSIDQQRYNFQFSGQQFWEIKGGKLIGQLNDVAYQGNTIQFWNSMEAVGGKDTFILFGTFQCGKGLPGQAASASHGCPAGLFRSVNVLNSAREG
jgi:TldD protein